MLVSAMLAMVRGFSREILSIASWVAAAAAAYFFYSPLLPLVQPYHRQRQDRDDGRRGRRRLRRRADRGHAHHHEDLATSIIDSRVGALDRTLGFLYGAARGMLVVVVALLFFNWLVGAKSAGLGRQRQVPAVARSIGDPARQPAAARIRKAPILEAASQPERRADRAAGDADPPAPAEPAPDEPRPAEAKSAGAMTGDRDRRHDGPANARLG